VAGVRAGRSDSGGVDGSGGGVGRVPGWVRRCRSRICGSPVTIPRVAVAAAWLARGSPESPAAARLEIAEVEAFCAGGSYPRTRFDAGGLAAAELLRRVGHGDVAEMGVMLAQGVPPVSPSVMLVPGPDLTGRVVTYRWPAGGPPEALLGPSGPRPKPGADTSRVKTCQRCGKPLNADGARGGRPAKYCSGASRTAAHRARHRTAPDSTGHRRSLTRSLHDEPASERTAELAANLRSCVPIQRRRGRSARPSRCSCVRFRSSATSVAVG